MIGRIEALNYRALRDVDVRVGPFEILVGPNGSGKSSLLDVIAFLGDILRVGPARAILGDARLGVSQRSPDPGQLCWMRQGHRFELAIEAQIPTDRKARLKNGSIERCRYEVALNVKEAIVLEAETLWLVPAIGEDEMGANQQQLFPVPREPRPSVVRRSGSKTPRGWKKVVAKTGESGNDYFMAETSGWNNPFRLGPEKSALANLPEDEERFPVATWFERLLMESVQRVVLSSEAMRSPSPPGLPIALQPDGSNLPWIVSALGDEARKEWVAHLRTSLRDLQSISTIERPEDKHRYLVLKHSDGLEVPSWLVSDGTLRLLALTLLAYIPGLSGIYLIEEPENGIHPRAVETVFEALSQVHESQILCASHAPLLVGRASLDKLLCFARSHDSAIAIVRGSEHPRLKEWRGEVDLGTYFASGVLE
ncbi:MAG: AAA family ATPase [Deltaproteobacteria bacterium]|nr:AAA family ATPase [Deltaproteobacteria bacterium]